MPVLDVSVPAELALALETSEVDVSAVCRQALAEALRTVGPARKAVEAIRDPDFDPARYPQMNARLGAKMTPRLHEALELARQLAGPTGAVGSSELLRGLFEGGDNLGVRLLQSLAVDGSELRAALDVRDTEASGSPAASPFVADPTGSADRVGAGLWAGFTLVARRVMASALEMSIELGSNHIGCEHLALGLISDESGAAGPLLRRFGVDLASALRAVELGEGRDVTALGTTEHDEVAEKTRELLLVARRQGYGLEELVSLLRSNA